MHLSKYFTILGLVFFTACASVWKPGTSGYVKYRQETIAKYQSMESKRLLKYLDDAKSWKEYKHDPAGRYYKLKMKYYAITDILRDRLEEDMVFEAFCKMTDKYEYSSVARDSIRFLEQYLDLEDSKIDILDEFVKIYADFKTHRDAKNEILNILVERKIKCPELLWHIRDERDRVGDDAHLEDVYIGFLNAG